MSRPDYDDSVATPYDHASAEAFEAAHQPVRLRDRLLCLVIGHHDLSFSVVDPFMHIAVGYYDACMRCGRPRR